MNIKKAGSYSIGLDLGTGSVGWAVVDENGELYHRYGKPTLGARIFPSAQTAAARRVKRGQRRRYNRRRQRIDKLQEVFLPEMAKLDPGFFIRMRQSSLLPEDRTDVFGEDARHALFNGTDFTESAYYDSFPTIWHLRRFLMSSDEKADLRLIYLALHNIVKRRGNFLREDEKGITASSANASMAVRNLVASLDDYVDLHGEEGLSLDADVAAMEKAIDAKDLSASARAKEVESALHLSDAKVAKAIARACVGYKVEFSTVFIGLEKSEETNFAITNDEKVESFLSICPDDGQALFDCIRAVYSAFALSSILQGASSLSEAMVRSYERHKSDLAIVKGLIKDHLGLAAYRKMFRGPKLPSGEYDINKLPKASYTAYIAGDKLAKGTGCSHEDFIKNLRKVLSSSDAILKDDRYRAIEARLNAEDSDFLAKQKTRSNGAIPFQLHLEEMNRIIEKQSLYYPFLLEQKELLDKLVSSRIPYYVGPLNAGRDPAGYYPNNTVDHTRKFAWSVRRTGMEHAAAYPWNVDEVIDTDKTAELFIRRMTGTCTYLYGEPVLPRCSLLYEEFCVLNELNGARWCEAGKDPHRFDWADREDIIEELFKGRKTVSSKVVANWLRERETVIDPVLSGTQAEDGFKSKLNSYNDFCKILNVRRLEDDDCPLSYGDIEQIILWNTVFEDRSIFKRKLQQEYGNVLDESQIRKMVNKRYTGWGRLSEKLLTKLKVDTPQGPMSIMGILRHGDPMPGHHRGAMILMEILHEDKFGFEALIDQANSSYLAERGEGLTIDDLQGSPALKRTVNQTMRVLDDIVSLTGHAPSRICIEVTRDDDLKKKGKRTSTRHQRLIEAMQKLREDAAEFDPEVLKELKSSKEGLDNERLVLYFLQNGKSLYSGRPLDINDLGSGKYEVDHIIPRCYTKDDSFDNKALVYKEENQRKLDSLLLDSSIIHARRSWWAALNRAGLISDKKFRNLTCTQISDRMLRGFINRQLVETSQIVKFVRQMCEQRFPGTQVISVRASLGHGVRERCGLIKCRELNNYHHAHDAYIACEVARFMECRYPKWQDGFDLAMVRKYVKSLGDTFSSTRRLPGRSGFIVDSFMRDGFDKNTGEVFKDQWDASAVIARMKRVMGYKSIFITRMPEEQTGAFWDETVYSPRDDKRGKGLAMPLKGYGTEAALSPSKYGGYNNVQRAYFFAFRAKDKKGNWKDFFEGVPIHLVSRINETSDTLREYAETIARSKKCHGAQILRAKIPLRQKFILDESVFYLYGRTGACNEIRSGKELAGNLEFSSLMSRVLDGMTEVTEDERVALLASVEINARRCCPKLASALKLDEIADNAIKLDNRQYARVMAQIARCYKSEQKGCDFTPLGLAASVGFLHPNLASVLPSIIWVDESPTGMYSHKTTYEDMLNGL